MPIRRLSEKSRRARYPATTVIHPGWRARCPAPVVSGGGAQTSARDGCGEPRLGIGRRDVRWTMRGSRWSIGSGEPRTPCQIRRSRRIYPASVTEIRDNRVDQYLPYRIGSRRLLRPQRGPSGLPCDSGKWCNTYIGARAAWGPSGPRAWIDANEVAAHEALDEGDGAHRSARIRLRQGPVDCLP